MHIAPLDFGKETKLNMLIVDSMHMNNANTKDR